MTGYEKVFLCVYGNLMEILDISLILEFFERKEKKILINF